jgi:NAD+ kinase
MKIAVYGKHFDEAFNAPIATLLERLNHGQHELRFYAKFMDFLRDRQVLPQGTFYSFNGHADLGACDLFISIGGDGTLLDSVTCVRDSQTPVLGINTGRLGFLSNVSTDEIGAASEAIEQRKFYLDPRSLIHVSSLDVQLDDFPYALNEVTIHKHDEASMVSVSAHMDEQFINTYWADGLIVSTPTGSTAYSLSCGGPIVMPGSKAFILTPIAPHNLNVRPLIVPNNCVLRLSADGRSATQRLTLDSRSFVINSGSDVFLRSAVFNVQLLNLEGQHFFSTIRNKLMWGLDKRN